MKNKLFLIATALVFSTVIANKPVDVNASSQISETITYADMIRHTAANNGQMYTGAQLVDYAIMHGNAKNDNVQAFTTYNASAGSLGTVGDNAYLEGAWKGYSLNDDGIIAVMTAKENMTVSNSWTVSGWVDPARFGLYKKSNGTMMQIVNETEITAENKSTIFAIENVFVAKGETLYYEFRFPWDGKHRTIQDLQAFNFTFTQDTTTIVEPTIKEANFRLNDMVVETGKANCGTVATPLVNYTVKHGDVATNNIQQFTSYDASSKMLGSSSDYAYAQDWVLYTMKNDGIIVEITAVENVKVDVTLPVEKSAGWTQATNIEVYKKSNDVVSLVKTTALTDNAPAASFAANVSLSKGETMYYQFIFEWGNALGDRRSLQTDLPNFTVSYVKQHQHDINQVESHMNLAYRYTAADNTSEFRLQVGVKASIVEMAASYEATWGIEVTSGSKTQKFDTVTKEDGEIKYVVIGLGDVLNNLDRATAVFSARAYIVVGETTYYSEAVKSYSVAQMIAEYKAQDKPVYGMYQAFVEAGLYQ